MSFRHSQIICRHCKEYTTLENKNSGVVICQKCKKKLRVEPRNCLKCDKLFYPKNKFNRLCNACNHEINEVTLYGIS